MVVVGLIEGVKLGVIETNGANMVGNHINHHPDVHGVGSRYESLQTLLASELGVDLFPVAGPVPVETVLGVVNNWRNPDCVEAQVLNILQVLHDSVEVTTTVVGLATQVAV